MQRVCVLAATNTRLPMMPSVCCRNRHTLEYVCVDATDTSLKATNEVCVVAATDTPLNMCVLLQHIHLQSTASVCCCNRHTLEYVCVAGTDTRCLWLVLTSRLLSLFTNTTLLHS